MRSLRYVPMILLFLAFDAFGRGDGTWPLRLRGDGTWPLRFSGESLSLEDPRTNALATSLTIQSLNEQPLESGPAANAIACSQQGDKHTATGTVSVGTTTFRIRGICYYAGNDTIEVISHTTIRQGNRTITTDSRMVGQVPESVAASNLFSGRLRVGAHTSEEGRYKFDVSKSER